MIGAVVLAAGLSSRMGRQKLLLPYGGRPLIRHVVESVSRGPVDVVVVVTGHDRLGVESAVADTGAQVVHNAEYASGMLSSVRIGIRALPESAAVMVVLGDQPVLPLALLESLCAHSRKHAGRIAVPKFGDRRGHPMIFGARFRHLVLCRYDGIGLRGLLQEHADAVDEIRVETDGVLLDIDTPEDYREALGRFDGGESG